MHPKLISISTALVGVLFSGGSASIGVARAEKLPVSKGVQITELTNRLRVEIGGQLFTEYHFKDVSRPFLYPIIGTGESKMTRNWPMKEAENEERDHPHHRSLWYAHGTVNGTNDFWSESQKAGKTVHEKFLEITSGKKSGVIRSQNKWVAKDGTVVATDDRTIRFSGSIKQPVIDYDITIHASNGEVKMGDTKEGTFAVRLVKALEEKSPKCAACTGVMLSSEGAQGEKGIWGKRAIWVDYSGTVDGEALGMAMFDHPRNPKHPTYWHARGYGLFAANPFGEHDFYNDKTRDGSMTIAPGQGLTFRYRLVVHPGDAASAKIGDLYRQWAK